MQRHSGLTFDSVGGPEEIELCIESASNGTDLIFSFESQVGSTYDILTSADLSSEPSTWPVFEEGIIADPSGTNTETFARPADYVRFFVLVEN